MKIDYEMLKAGWWIKVSPLARINPECWVAAVFKKGKVSWITEECKEFDNPESAFMWARSYVCEKTGDTRVQ
ncbi:hypothetical protein H8E06_00520 [bacterium]|nr:hypothetical protein [bacterium]